ncbi:hypothetical protein EW146_g6197 [Bondarzewia mesenterica]|uniref:GPI transamidase component PIG-T n=1 Tax=Bondarzewia mesenterica TaxID=1095465 RepID=A0A4S4LPB4_9AGAM|nr:hypothetical protein EW146_g6197 [Bondarzewia mesenterica]
MANSPRDSPSLCCWKEHYLVNLVAWMTMMNARIGFPAAVGQILREHAVPELHLTLNAGKWDYERWGYPDETGVGSGAELWAWMGDGGSSSIKERWKGMQNALAGLFCASLNGMNSQLTTSPTRAFPPAGDLPLLPTPHTYRLLHATLAAEHVCTENLTPFLKLLPCPARAGIASLLMPHKIFDADWHGLGVHVRWRSGVGVELALAVQVVFDPVRVSVEQKRDWSLRSVFDRTILHPCPVANSSRIRVKLPSDSGSAYSITPEPSEVHGDFATYDVSAVSDELDVALRWPEETAFPYTTATPSSALSDFSVQRALKGASQTHGQLSLVIRNNRPDEIRVLYLETMPWHVEFYLHTLRVERDGRPQDYLSSNLTYTPPIPHSHPALLQTVLTLPPLSTLRLSVDAHKSFLRYTEHPPDAQRGWNLPPAVFVSLSPSNSSVTSGREGRGWDGARRVYTSVMLVDLATPDFSMPYNVIIMSCTLFALIFGSVFNLLTRKFVVVKLPMHEERTHVVDR